MCTYIFFFFQKKSKKEGRKEGGRKERDREEKRKKSMKIKNGKEKDGRSLGLCSFDVEYPPCTVYF